MKQGIYVVRVCDKDVLYLGYSEHLEEAMERMKQQLSCGTCSNRTLQKLWQDRGPRAFHFEILDVLSGSRPQSTLKQSLVELQKRWFQRFTCQGRQIELL